MNGRKFNQAVFERNDEKKKKQEIIYERIWILGGLWRVIAYEYSSFIFLFLFLSKQSMKMLQCLSWKCCELLCFSWPKHRPTWKHFNCFQQNIDIILIIFSVIFLMSSETLLSEKRRLNLCTSCAINFLAMPTIFSKINYGNTSQIFQSIICLNDR